MHKSLLLPFIGCSVVAVLLFLSSSQRLAAQLSPEQISPELRKQIEEKIEKLVQRVDELEDKLKTLEHEMTRLRSKVSHLAARVR